MCANLPIDDTSFIAEGGRLVNRSLASVSSEATLANHTNDITCNNLMTYDNDNNDANSVTISTYMMPSVGRNFGLVNKSIQDVAMTLSSSEENYESKLVVQANNENIQRESNYHDAQSAQRSTAAASSSAAAADASAGPLGGASGSLLLAAALPLSEVGEDERKAQKAALSAKYKGRRRWKAVADPYGTSVKLKQALLTGFFTNNPKPTAGGAIGPQYENPGIATNFVETSLVNVFRADVPMSAPSSSQGDAADDPIVIDVSDSTRTINPIVVDVPDGTSTIDSIMVDDDNTTLNSIAAPSSRSINPPRMHTTRKGGVTKKRKTTKKAVNVDGSTVYDLITTDDDVHPHAPSKHGLITTQINPRDGLRLGNAPTSPNNAESTMVDEATPPVRSSSPDLPQTSHATGYPQQGPSAVHVTQIPNIESHGDEPNGTQAGNIRRKAITDHFSVNVKAPRTTQGSTQSVPSRNTQGNQTQRAAAQIDGSLTAWAGSSQQPPSKNDLKSKGKQKAHHQEDALLSDEELRQDEQRIPKWKKCSKSWLITVYGLSSKDIDDNLKAQGSRPSTFNRNGETITIDTLCYPEMEGEFLAWRRRGGYQGLIRFIYQRWCRWIKKHPEMIKKWRNEFKVPKSYIQPLVEKMEEEERKKNTEMEAGGSSSKHVDVDEETHEQEDEGLGEEDEYEDHGLEGYEEEEPEDAS